MKYVFAVAAVLALSACGSASNWNARMTGYDKKCINGVTYYQFPSGAVRGDNQQGNPIPC